MNHGGSAPMSAPQPVAPPNMVPGPQAGVPLPTPSAQ
jgi:hypothetical protein